MEDVTTPVLSGIAVLVAGILAFVVVIGGRAEAPPPSVENATHSGLEPSVERVLLSSGDAWVYQADLPAGIPAEVARVLDAYQVALLVPLTEGGEQ